MMSKSNQAHICGMLLFGCFFLSNPLLVSGKMDISQTISDEAQLKTIAFSGFGIVTGNLQAQSFFPPGKLVDYWGFQYLRDNDPDGMGHNTSFLTRIANNVLYILNETQLQKLIDLAMEQSDQINLYGYQRFTLMNAFRRQLDGDISYGSTGLNLDAVVQASHQLYHLDGQMSFDRAVMFSAIFRSLDSEQRAYLDAMKGHGFNSWPDVTDEDIRDVLAKIPPGMSVAVRTYAGDLFSWYAGSVEADVYFCPERHGTYFGSFYMKDAPAMGHPGYSIDEQMTATVGQEFLDILATTGLNTLITTLVDTQRNNLYAGDSNILLSRENISKALRSLIVDDEPSESFLAEVLTSVLDNSDEYGSIDGEIVYWYSMAFAQVFQALTTTQKDALWDIRVSILTGSYDDGTPFDFTICKNLFLFSEVITDPSVLDPYLAASESLFFEPENSLITLELIMPSKSYSVDDPCWLNLRVVNYRSTPVTGLPLFVILDIADHYWFAPKWTSGSAGIDFYQMDFPGDLTQIKILSLFPWPSGTGTGTATFWAAITSPDFTSLESTIGTWKFDWDTSP